jgi:hypothetical protein
MLRECMVATRVAVKAFKLTQAERAWWCEESVAAGVICQQVLSVAVILQDKLTIIPSLPHLRSEDWQVFPHHGIPDLANLTLPLEHRAISQLQHKVGQFLLARRIMWRLSGSGHDCFPDTPELRFDF